MARHPPGWKSSAHFCEGEGKNRSQVEVSEGNIVEPRSKLEVVI